MNDALSKVKDALAKIDKAREVVNALCDGRIKWTLSVPARPESDPDLVIAGALQAAKEALCVLTSTEQEPVALEYRHIESNPHTANFGRPYEWTRCGPEKFAEVEDFIAQGYAYEVRKLYASPVNAWQPIETAPKDGTYILLGAKCGAWIGKYLPVYQSGFKPDNPWSSMMLNHDHMSEKWYVPTHWTPLPPAPDAALAQKGGGK